MKVGRSELHWAAYLIQYYCLVLKFNMLFWNIQQAGILKNDLECSARESM